MAGSDERLARIHFATSRSKFETLKFYNKVKAAIVNLLKEVLESTKKVIMVSDTNSALY